MKLSLRNFRTSELQKIGLFLILTCFVSVVRCGEGDGQRQQYEVLRGQLINSSIMIINALTALRIQFPSDRALDNAVTGAALNDLFQNLTPQARNILHLLFVSTNSANKTLEKSKIILRFLQAHPYDEMYGVHLMNILEQIVALGHEAITLVGNFAQNINNVPQEKIPGITILYLLESKQVNERLMKLIDDMRLMD